MSNNVDTRKLVRRSFDDAPVEMLRTIDHLVSRWKEADITSLRKLFPLLAEGKPVSPAQFSKVIGKDIVSTEKILQAGRTDRDSRGRVTELYGVTLSPTPHRIVVEDVALFSCCAMVSQMVPLLLGKNGTVESIDPINNRIIKIRISANDIQSVEPKESVASFVITNQKDILDKLCSAFCCHVRHFVNEETAAEFISMDSRRYMISIDRLHQIASQLQEDIWGQRENQMHFRQPNRELGD